MPPKKKTISNEAHEILEQEAKELTKASIEGSEDFGGNIPFNPNGFVEQGERVVQLDRDPRRHMWGSPVQEPVDTVVFRQVPREEPTAEVQDVREGRDQTAPERSKSDDKNNNEGQG